MEKTEVSAEEYFGSYRDHYKWKFSKANAGDLDVLYYIEFEDAQKENYVIIGGIAAAAEYFNELVEEAQEDERELYHDYRVQKAVEEKIAKIAELSKQPMIKKITEGCVIQSFTKDGEFISQEFKAGDSVEFEYDDGCEGIETDGFYHSFDY